MLGCTNIPGGTVYPTLICQLLVLGFDLELSNYFPVLIRNSYIPLSLGGNKILEDTGYAVVGFTHRMSTPSLILIKILQRNRTNGRHIYSVWYIWFIKRNWLMWLWRLRSPMICQLHARDLGNLVVQFWSKFKDLRTRGADGVNPRTGEEDKSSSGGPSSRTGEDCCPSLSWARTGSSLTSLFVLFRYLADWIIPICSVCLLNPPIQMLISSRNTLTDTSRNNV